MTGEKTKISESISIPDNFFFTQQSLKTFDHCPLKFKMRYMEKLRWDTLPDEEARKNVERGNNFHLLARRYFMGAGTGLEPGMEEYPQLNEWVERLKQSFGIDPEAVYYPEYKCRLISGDMKLEANYDLMIVRGDTVEIWDWKTHGSRNGIKDSGYKYKTSMQTAVYMFVLGEQRERITGKKLQYKNINMYYWQPENSCIEAHISYNQELHDEFRQTLEYKIKSIKQYDYSGFNRALYGRHCKYCEFNCFCNNA